MRVTIDSKGLNESNPEAGTSLNVVGNIIATGLTVNGPISGSTISISIPNNPTYYIASTGNDGITHTGTISDPLASPQEACKRLAQSGWTGAAMVITKDTVDLGSFPYLNVPEPIGSALPVCFQTTYQTDFTGVVVTGGSAGTFSGTVVGGTFVSVAVGGGANAQRGKVLVPTTGALTGSRYIIHADDGAGTLTAPAELIGAAAPVNGTTFDIKSRVGKWTWTNTLMMTGQVKLIDGMVMLPVGSVARFFNEGVLQTSAMLWQTTSTFILCGRDSTWLGGVFQNSGTAPIFVTPLRQDWNPPGVTHCGDRYDGSGGIITVIGGSGNGQYATMQYSESSFQGCDFFINGTTPNYVALHSCTLNDCGLAVGNTGFNINQLGLSVLRIESGRRIASTTTGAVISIISQGNYMGNVTFVSPSVADDLIGLRTGGSVIITGLVGAASAAGKLALNIQSGGRVIDGGSNTATGGTVGTDIAVDGGTGFAIARLTDYGIIEAGRVPWLRSVDTSAVPATTANSNRTLGVFSLAAASGATFTWTNALAQVGDSAIVTLQFRDTTAVAPIAVVTANTITITFNAAATSATKFMVQLVKATS